MFFPNDGGFWRPQEQANQFVHWFFGFIVAVALWYAGCGNWSVLGGFIGVLEMLRQIIFDHPTIDKDFWLDKFRDNCFYWLGAISIFPIIGALCHG